MVLRMTSVLLPSSVLTLPRPPVSRVRSDAWAACRAVCAVTHLAASPSYAQDASCAFQNNGWLRGSCSGSSCSFMPLCVSDLFVPCLAKTLQK